MTEAVLEREHAHRPPYVALAIIALALATALLADVIAPKDPFGIDPGNAQLPPAFVTGGSWEFPLGTDRLGRDILSRIVLGTRLSLGVAAVALLIGAGIGAVLGLLAGYRGGWVDTLIMRVG